MAKLLVWRGRTRFAVPDSAGEIFCMLKGRAECIGLLPKARAGVQLKEVVLH